MTKLQTEVTQIFRRVTARTFRTMLPPAGWKSVTQYKKKATKYRTLKEISTTEKPVLPIYRLRSRRTHTPIQIYL